MRFGMSGCFLPDDMRAFSPQMCRQVRALGFSGVFTRFRANDPHTTPRADAQALRNLFGDEGVRLYQVTGYWQNMITSDETRRAEAVRTIQAALRFAGWLGARGIDTGPGSMNPDGPWFPHPDNHTATARRQLVRTLKECAKAAADAQVFLSLESHQLVTLKTPETPAPCSTKSAHPGSPPTTILQIGSHWKQSSTPAPRSTIISMCSAHTSAVATPRTSGSRIGSRCICRTAVPARAT